MRISRDVQKSHLIAYEDIPARVFTQRGSQALPMPPSRPADQRVIPGLQGLGAWRTTPTASNEGMCDLSHTFHHVFFQAHLNITARQDRCYLQTVFKRTKMVMTFELQMACCLTRKLMTLLIRI